MSAEFIAAMGGNNNQQNQTEHEVTRLVAGEVETVRARLIPALEQFGYRVVDENPLWARRAGNDWGKGGCSTYLYDYPAKLGIGLRAAGSATTRVVFAYSIQQMMTTEGDRQTLAREADALLALAQNLAQTGACLHCGATLVAGTRFCRQCGAPQASGEPAEVELVRLTANVRAAYQAQLWGLGLSFVAVLPLLAMLWLDPTAAKYEKRLIGLGIVATMFAGMGLPFFFSGLQRLRRMTQMHATDEHAARPLPLREPVATAIPNTNDLPALPPPVQPVNVPASITEATIGLLPVEQRQAGS